MPFDDEFDDIYKLGIQAVATECGVVAERVDEQNFSETILERIYRQIEVADFIIADMTGRNPNVFYEVGYAHARGKLCTLLTQSAEDIPFDLRHHRHIVYNGKIQSLKSKLRHEIEWLKNEIEKRNSSAFTVNLKKINSELKKTDFNAKAVVEFVFDITNNTTKKSPEIEAIYIHTGSKWSYVQSGEDCPSAASEDDKSKVRHFIKSPVQRLSPGAWAQIKIEGTKEVWSKWKGEKVEEKYNLSGNVIFEIYTSEGTYRETMFVETVVEEYPF